MGMSSLLDPNAAKEFLRRATALGMNTAAMAAAAASSGGGSGSTPPSLKGGLKMDGGGGGGGPSDPGSPHANDPSGLRRPRSVYNSSQVAQLEAYFRFNEYIDGERKRRLSSITNIPEHQIKVWFQNRRQKKKREEAEMMQGGSAGGSGGSGAGPGMPNMNFKEEPGAIGAHMIQTMDEDEDDYGGHGNPGGGGGMTPSGGGGPNHDDPGDEEEPITGDPIAASYQA